VDQARRNDNATIRRKSEQDAHIATKAREEKTFMGSSPRREGHRNTDPKRKEEASSENPLEKKKKKKKKNKKKKKIKQKTQPSNTKNKKNPPNRKKKKKNPKNARVKDRYFSIILGNMGISFHAYKAKYHDLSPRKSNVL